MPFISSGSYGCIFKPYVKCSNKNPKLTNKNIIGKIFENKDDSDSEHKIALLINKIDPLHKFTLPFYGDCDVNKFSKSNAVDKCEHIDLDVEDTYRQLLYQYGGIDLLNYMEKNKPTPQKLKKLLNAMKVLIEGVVLLNEKSYSHLDIKPDNIVFDGKKLYLIDFGMLTKTSQIYKLNFILDHDYPFFPPEFKSSVHKQYNNFYTRFYENFNFRIVLAGKQINLEDTLKNFIKYTEEEQNKDLQSLFKNKRKYTKYVDIYALGIVLALLLNWSNSKNEDLKKLVKQMVCFDAKKRISGKDLLDKYNYILENL